MNKILITGAKGFIGKNLVAELNNRKAGEVLEFDKDNDPIDLETFAKECDFVFHLAGVNRPEKPEEFTHGNFDLTVHLTNLLTKFKNKAPVILSSSTQAALDNDYGKSKKAAEDALFQYSKDSGVPVIAYRLPNVFGKWCRPSYNSVVATFCHNIAHDLPIQINNPESQMSQVYIDDVVTEFINKSGQMMNSNASELIEDIKPVYPVTLGNLAEKIRSFRGMRTNLEVPEMSDDFTKKLYATYLSYLPEDGFSYPLKMNIDNRGSFTEFIRTPDRGQISVNISKPGIVKGNHWHHTKNEKFLVVKGKGMIRFRKIGTEKVIEYAVSGDKLEVVDIPTGYTHNIENLGETEMVTIMWASEAFDAEHPDTFFEVV